MSGLRLNNGAKSIITTDSLVEDPGDSEYLVTADMLIHEDMDDERTLEEEEGTWADEANDQEELQDLQKVHFCIMGVASY